MISLTSTRRKFLGYGAIVATSGMMAFEGSWKRTIADDDDIHLKEEKMSLNRLFKLFKNALVPTLVLGAVLAVGAPAATPVKIDVKPGTCPNVLPLQSEGKLAVAILGTS